MTNNEKKMMVALGKSLVLQMDLNLELIRMFPGEKTAALRAAYENIEKEIDIFVGLAGKEWGIDDED